MVRPQVTRSFVPTGSRRATARNAGQGWPKATAKRRGSVLDRRERGGTLNRPGRPNRYQVNGCYAFAVIERLAASGQTIVLQMDQSHINDMNEVLMLSVRLRKRALPVAWRVHPTQGNIGFGVQTELLDGVHL